MEAADDVQAVQHQCKSLVTQQSISIQPRLNQHTQRRRNSLHVLARQHVQSHAAGPNDPASYHQFAIILFVCGHRKSNDDSKRMVKTTTNKSSVSGNPNARSNVLTPHTLHVVGYPGREFLMQSSSLTPRPSRQQMMCVQCCSVCPHRTRPTCCSPMSGLGANWRG